MGSMWYELMVEIKLFTMFGSWKFMTVLTFSENGLMPVRVIWCREEVYCVLFELAFATLTTQAMLLETLNWLM